MLRVAKKQSHDVLSENPRLPSLPASRFVWVRAKNSRRRTRTALFACCTLLPASLQRVASVNACLSCHPQLRSAEISSAQVCVSLSFSLSFSLSLSHPLSLSLSLSLCVSVCLCTSVTLYKTHVTFSPGENEEKGLPRWGTLTHSLAL